MKMNEFVDDMTMAVKRAVTSVGTGISVAAQQQRVKETYEAIGKLYCQTVGEGKEPTGEAFDTQVRRVNELLEQIRQAKENQSV